MHISTTLNACFTKRLRRNRGSLRGSWSAFRVCAFVGLVCSVGVTAILAVHLDLSLWTMLWILLSALLTLLGVVMLSRINGRAQQLVFYRHLIVVMLVVATLVWLIGQPLLPYLDVTVLGIGAFVACGRIGCLMVGCCHGRPSSFGICYREWQITPAFPSQFLGVRLFPIQAMESLWAAGIVVGGCMLLWNQYVPGVGVGWFIATYCPARFIFEFFRWRPSDSYTGGLSEAQWTSLGLLSLIVVLESLDQLPSNWWHAATLFGLGVLTFSLVLTTSLRRIIGTQNDAHNSAKDIPKAVRISDESDACN